MSNRPNVIGAAFIALSILLNTSVFAQVIPFNETYWDYNDKVQLTDYLGEKSIRLHGQSAQLRDSIMVNGTIEFYLAFPEKRGFVGASFRDQGGGNHEEFYVRPHQSGKPDANQYNPSYNSNASWQLYFGTDYSVNVEYKFNE